MTAMPPKAIEFHPLAIAEARAARRRYAKKSLAVADRFMSELDRAIERATSAPERWPSYFLGTRVIRLRRFPHLFVYRETTTSVQVVAIAHSARRPGYWRKRLT